MQNRVGKFTRSMSGGFHTLNRNVDKFSAGMKRAGATTAAALMLAGFAFSNIIGAGAGFEQAITNVGAVSLKTRAEIKPLEDMALQLGATTKFTATQAAEAMEILARAGFDVNQILDATPATLSAAAASGLEIAEVADHVSNVLKGMGLEMSQAGRVADVLALASSRTNSTIGTLGESMRNVAATARQLNIPLEDTVAAVALLQDVGLDASVAGSAFNTMLTKMAAPSKQLQTVMRRLGVSFKDAKGDMLPLNEVIEQLNSASKRMGGNFDQVAFLAELVGLRGQKAAANLAQLFETGKLGELSAELLEALGTSEKMSKLRMNTLLGSWTLLQSAIDAVKVQIGGMTGGPLKELVDEWTAWVTANKDLIASKVAEYILKIVHNIDKIASAAIRIAKLVAVLWTLSTVLKAVAAIITIVNFLMAMNPVGLIIIGIAALIAAVVAVVFWLEELHAWFNSLGPVAKAAFVIFGGPLAWLVAFGPKVLEAWEPVKSFFVDLFTVISDLANLFLAVHTFGLFGEFNNPFTRDDEAANGPPARPIGISGPNQTTVQQAVVTLRDETGRAEVSSSSLGSGLVLQQSGAFN